MRIAYLGNFGPPSSTENHIAASFESLGHEVVHIQEGSTPACDVPVYVDRSGSELFLHTQTYSLAVAGGTLEERSIMVDSIRALGVPSAGFHLDRWWGLGRQDQVFREPFFRYDYLFTADGGHDPMWEELGINHHWLPPGIYHAEAINGIAHGRYLSDIAFVGSWRSYGHPEWESHRMEMLRVLRQKFGSRFRCWPQHGGIRGKELASLYASTKIVIGDSCLAPNVYDQPIERYWSDRIPETTGRGGFLIHPEVAGLSEIHPSVVTYPLGNNEALVELISRYLSDADQRVQLRNLQAEETRSTNTYRDRIVQMLRDMGYAKGEAAEYCRENH